MAGISQATFSDRMQRNEGFRVGELISLAAGLNIPISNFLVDLDEAYDLAAVDRGVIQ